MSTSPQPNGRYAWVVLNQSQSPAFQHLMGRLAQTLGSCLLVTGMPHPNAEPLLTVVKAPTYDRTSVKTRLRSWAAFMVSATTHMARVRGRPFLLTVTNPPMLPHLGLALSRIRRWPTGILVWDLYPDHVVQRGWMSKQNPVMEGWRTLNRQAYRRASTVITLGPGMAAAIREQALQPSLAVTVIPNWADTTELRPLAKAENPFALEHCRAGAVTVMYSGNLGATHSLGALFEAAECLVLDSSIEFLIVGEGLQAETLERQRAELGLTNLKMLPYQSWANLRYSLAAADIAIVSQERSTSHLSVPSKTYSGLAVGSAILALTSYNSDLAQLVREHRLGLVCEPDDAEEITSAIARLAGDATELHAMRKRCREVSERLFSEEAVESQFISAIGPHIGLQ